MRKAIYAFSGDPITIGHINIIERAAKLFDELVVAIGVNPTKRYLFTLEQRKRMAETSLLHIKNVTVTSFTGLLVDFAYESGAEVIVRGVRSEADMEYERNLYWLGHSQRTQADTVVLFARQEFAHISSSAVREIQASQGLVQEFVPLAVKQALERKISGQYLIGVTGEPGVGKNFISEKLVAYATSMAVEAHHIDLDLLGHEILNNILKPAHSSVKQQLILEFGDEIMLDSGVINREVLSEIVFDDAKKRNKLNKLLSEPLLIALRKKLFGKKGLIVLNGALFAEFNWLSLVNNQVILVDAPEGLQFQWLKDRGWTDDKISKRLLAQEDHQTKKSVMEKIIQKTGYGNLMLIVNDPEKPDLLVTLYQRVQLQLELPKGK